MKKFSLGWRIVFTAVLVMALCFPAWGQTSVSNSHCPLYLPALNPHSPDF